MSPNSGRFAWQITDRDIPAGVNALTAAIFIAEPFTDSDGNGTTLEGNDRFEGPRVGITRGNRRTDGPGGTGGINTTGGAIVNDNNNNNNNNSNNPASNMGAIGSGGPNAVAIALPVVFGALTLMLMTALVVFKRRNPGWSLREAIVKGVPGMLRRKLRPAGPRAGMMGGPAVVKRAGTGKRIRGEDIRVVTTDINGLRMNAMRMAGGGVGGGMMGGGGTGGYGEGAFIRAEGSGNVFREELRRQERSMV